jgi:shikimate dehydrogenase
MRGTITGKTIVCGIIGDPIGHSLSPIMHNKSFKKLGLDYVYVPFRVRSGELKKAVDGMRGLSIRGLNITIPHKVAVIQFLDRIDPLAEEIGAINTIINDGGILTGYNTDASGFLKTLRDNGIQPAGKKVLLLGAGGAARAIGSVLAQEKAKLTIFNRLEGLPWAEDIAYRLAHLNGTAVKAVELNYENLKAAIADAEILVNATSVGMHPADNQTPVSADLLHANLTVFDIVYNPLPTRLLKEAADAGAKTIGGVEMLVRQGAISFEKWTGRSAPVDVMRESVLSSLSQKNEK